MPQRAPRKMVGSPRCPGYSHRAARIEELAFNRLQRGLDTLESMASPNFGHAFERILFVVELHAQPTCKMHPAESDSEAILSRSGPLLKERLNLVCYRSVGHLILGL